jgi:hypothetical protein
MIPRDRSTMRRSITNRRLAQLLRRHIYAGKKPHLGKNRVRERAQARPHIQDAT